jgi:hypothetical protein
MSNKKYSDIKQMDHTPIPTDAHFSFRKNRLDYSACHKYVRFAGFANKGKYNV